MISSKRKSGRRGLTNKLFWYIGMTFCSLVFIAPVVWMLSTSLKAEGDTIESPVTWIPRAPTIDNFIYAIERSPYPIGRAFFNSLFVSSVTVICVLCINSLAAYAFARMEFKGRDILFIMVLSMLMVPFQVILVPLFLFFWRLKLANSYLSLTTPMFASAFAVFLLRQFFINIPKDLEDAARIDGCSKFRIFIKIILPLSKPVMATLAIFTFLGSWNSFEWPLIILTKAHMMTLPIALAYLLNSGVGRASLYGKVMAASFVSSVPALIVFIIAIIL